MCNYDRLGIGKEMQEHFSSQRQEDLERLQKSCYFENPLITKRENGKQYCMVKVINCESPDWWYANLTDLEFFCEIVWEDYGYGKFIKDFRGVILTNTKAIVLRGFSPEDVIII